jgi:pyruvate,water dikinase
VAEAREKLVSHPVDLTGQFEALLGAAQSCSFLQEDHNHWIDQRGLHEVRQVSLAVGRRLVEAGKLASSDDVFLFTVPELRELASGTASGIDTAGKRRAEMARWATITPPSLVGTDYGPPPDNPITRAIGRMFGAPPQASDDNVIRGNAGSRGKVSGIARVINTIDEADRLGVGEILVAPTTSPPWTPLFGIAAAVVTDTGGALSHCAVVCREYGIPAVVGTQVATSRIRDGQPVEVDGDEGAVRLL